MTSSNSNNNNYHRIQRSIHYVLSQAEAVHLTSLDVETLKQILLTKLMIGGTPSHSSALVVVSNSSMRNDVDGSDDGGNEELALMAARRVTADASAAAAAFHDSEDAPLSPQDECHELCERILQKLNDHKRATLRAISAARNYDSAWANLVPTVRRFEVSLPLDDIQSVEGKMTISEHISRCALAMRALAVWQASAVHLVEAVVLWRSGLNRPFPFSIDGHCNILLRVALDAAAIKSSPIPHPLLIGGAGVNLDQVIIPSFFSHLPSICEFALVSSSCEETGASVSSAAMTPQRLFGFGGGGGTSSHNSSGNANSNSSFFSDPRNSYNDNSSNSVMMMMSSATDNASCASMVSTSGEDELVKSLARRWERRVIGMHFASKQDAVAWALEAAEDVVASFASLPGRRGQVQENYLKRVRAAEYTIALEHNTHWQLMKELLSLCAEGKHVPLLHLPGVVFPRGGEDGVPVECPQLLEGLFRTLVSAIEALNAVTQSPDEEQHPDQPEEVEDEQEHQQRQQQEPEQQQLIAVQQATTTTTTSGRGLDEQIQHDHVPNHQLSASSLSFQSQSQQEQHHQEQQQHIRPTSAASRVSTATSSQGQTQSKSASTTGRSSDQGYGYGNFML